MSTLVTLLQLQDLPTEADRAVASLEESTREALAAEAKKLLGYSRVRVKIGRSEASWDLASTLRELKIRPFTKESVAAYMAAAVEQGTWKVLNNHPRWKKIANIVSICAEILCFLSLVVGSIAGLILFFRTVADLEGNWLWFWTPAILGLVSFYLACAGSRPTWERFSFDGYDRSEIPPMVVQTALRIKREIPEATFEIVELVVPTRIRDAAWLTAGLGILVGGLGTAAMVMATTAVVIDPFLVVKHGDAKEYVGVWDEEGYTPAFQSDPVV